MMMLMQKNYVGYLALRGLHWGIRPLNLAQPLLGVNGGPKGWISPCLGERQILQNITEQCNLRIVLFQITRIVLLLEYYLEDDTNMGSGRKREIYMHS